MNDERISSSSSMGSILPSSVCRLSDIEEPHFLRVLLDERAARLDLVAHQHRKDLIGRLDVFHGHELEGARHGVHGCLLYTSDAADEEDSVDLGGRRIIKR